jgi:hypothetical protein
MEVIIKEEKDHKQETKGKGKRGSLIFKFIAYGGLS